jgi:hypothetical protein
MAALRDAVSYVAKRDAAGTPAAFLENEEGDGRALHIILAVAMDAVAPCGAVQLLR